MEYEFDEDGWIDSILMGDAAVADKFVTNAIFEVILRNLSIRDRTWITDGIHRDPARQKVWHDAKAHKALAVYDRLMMRMPWCDDERG